MRYEGHASFQLLYQQTFNTNGLISVIAAGRAQYTAASTIQTVVYCDDFMSSSCKWAFRHGSFLLSVSRN